MKYLRNYIQSSLANGKYFFTKEEVVSELKITPSQFRFQAYRLAKKRVVKSLIGDFFMIVPAEYQHLGSLPPHWIIDSLMQHLGEDYYIGHLSAASLYGATHQQPMSFQVITNKARRNIKLERGMIEFHCYKNCSSAAKEQITLPTGYVKISTREQTLLDLVRFYTSCGYLSNVATVVKDLSKECKPQLLARVVKNEKTDSVLQRLGYILEFTGYHNMASVIEQQLKKRKIQFICLRPDCCSNNCQRANRWKLLINDILEVEPRRFIQEWSTLARTKTS
ncbi:type IV toxin-antitoxin system AbiEi family antitoxin domain-containing protein [Wolbachia endosymbiont of Folsomia candida]|uniref:type IV toxin-antitoxin system AbiEi family antitoxin domain-containing protein n=1 Tax=Wolbachia endosymbiont of Folsomia candida TaxID=169402 RepID=UPI000A7ADF62|nr:type IV toxin-antitoxin system AbiEi family antitoxin [Wolbachia endosymbiont of Folsomia candida]APR99008.1 hypothetical protein ASM33_07430 [Wolbachia endosymbiont of Folsomia candida]